MNIAIIGGGKMGAEIERLAPSRNIRVAQVFEIDHPVNNDELQDVDVCIDVSTPDAVLRNITIAAESGKNIVVGTTGWEADRSRAIDAVRAYKTGLLVASNFSIGVNLFFRVISETARMMDNITAYDVSVHEIHHKAKKDSPSGTALTIAQLLCRYIDRKNEILAGSPEGPIKPEQLHVTSERIGSVFGTHRVLFDSDADSIELVHTAKNRSGFALGALLAAEWLRGKQGIFTMDDVIAL